MNTNILFVNLLQKYITRIFTLLLETNNVTLLICKSAFWVLKDFELWRIKKKTLRLLLKLIL